MGRVVTTKWCCKKRKACSRSFVCLLLLVSGVLVVWTGATSHMRLLLSANTYHQRQPWNRSAVHIAQSRPSSGTPGSPAMAGIAPYLPIAAMARTPAWTKLREKSVTMATVTTKAQPSTVTKELIQKSIEDYFKPRNTKVNPHSFKFIIEAPDLCGGPNPFLLIMVPSLHGNTEIRAAIRETWGSYVRNRTWPRRAVTEESRLVFLFGRGQTPADDALVLAESERHGDIVQEDFQESYRNLTHKTLAGLKWASLHCSNATFILKADEDTFVVLPNLVKLLRNSSSPTAIHGSINTDSRVSRDHRNKWFVSQGEYPFPTYPNYAAGTSYVIPAGLASALFNVSEYMPYIPMEDVYVTGILAKVVGASHVRAPGFAIYFIVSRPCDFLQLEKISGTHVAPPLMRKIWETLQSRRGCEGTSSRNAIT